ncbi:MAG: hypothetical protein M1814_000088 [Vezdaea aestivalis]|nr:MAG: hypothetical protein M1814_000088 [Vezdaea aestivalis]
MSFQPEADITLMVMSPYSSSERRITPGWSIAQLKAKLEPVTGIPPSAQELVLRTPGTGGEEPLRAVDENTAYVGQWRLVKGAELHIRDLRPASARPNFTDVSGVEKYTMPVEQYETLTDSVLAWKKTQKLGRFNPLKPSPSAGPTSERAIPLNARCRISPSRHGIVRYTGAVPSLPNPSSSTSAWVGVELDEPTGRNDGCAPDGTRYFTCPKNHGVFVRPERVEIGDFEVLGLGVDEGEEEI